MSGFTVKESSGSKSRRFNMVCSFVQLWFIIGEGLFGLFK